jgi:hypothetical protein
MAPFSWGHDRRMDLLDGTIYCCCNLDSRNPICVLKVKVILTVTLFSTKQHLASFKCRLDKQLRQFLRVVHVHPPNGPASAARQEMVQSKGIAVARRLHAHC